MGTYKSQVMTCEGAGWCMKCLAYIECLGVLPQLNQRPRRTPASHTWTRSFTRTRELLTFEGRVVDSSSRRAALRVAGRSVLVQNLFCNTSIAFNLRPKTADGELLTGD